MFTCMEDANASLTLTYTRAGGMPRCFSTTADSCCVMLMFLSPPMYPMELTCGMIETVEQTFQQNDNSPCATPFDSGQSGWQA